MSAPPTTEPPEGEYERRHERLRQALHSRALDGAIFSRSANIYYLTNFRASPITAWTARFHVVAVPVEGRPRLVARFLESDSAALQWTPDPILCVDHEDPYQALASALHADSGSWAGLTRLGIEKRFLTVAQLDSLTNVFPQAEFVDVSGLVEDLASETSDWELGCIERAAAVTTAGMTAALEALVPGHFPYDVLGDVQKAMYAHGQSDFEKSFVAVWSGPRGGMMHDTRTTQQLVDGDVATVEIMGVDRHYFTCAQTSVLVGRGDPSPEVRSAYELVIAMHEAALNTVRGGALAGDVFAAADSIYHASTGHDYFRRVGGSIGLTLFALDLVKDSAAVLPVGTPLLVQVLVNDPVLLTCTSSVVVTPTGHEVLTPSTVDSRLRAQ
jgi:Xaa-Pro dipeptidase